jgi:hypothetical protein
MLANVPDLILIIAGVLLIVAAILILVAGRRDDDTGGTRAQMRYVGTIGILTLFTVLFAAFAVVQALTGFIVDGHNDNALYRNALDNGLLALTAGVVFVFHYRRVVVLAPAGRLARGATGSAARAALYGVCFVAAIVALFAAAKAVYGVFQIIAPGVFGTGGNAIGGGLEVPPAFQDFLPGSGGGGGDVVREQGIADVLSYTVLTLGSVVIFLRSWNWLPEHR